MSENLGGFNKIPRALKVLRVLRLLRINKLHKMDSRTIFKRFLKFRASIDSFLGKMVVMLI